MFKFVNLGGRVREGSRSPPNIGRVLPELVAVGVPPLSKTVLLLLQSVQPISYVLQCFPNLDEKIRKCFGNKRRAINTVQHLRFLCQTVYIVNIICMPSQTLVS